MKMQLTINLDHHSFTEGDTREELAAVFEQIAGLMRNNAKSIANLRSNLDGRDIFNRHSDVVGFVGFDPELSRG